VSPVDEIVFDGASGTTIRAAVADYEVRLERS
jgi:hypothetical protein